MNFLLELMQFVVKRKKYILLPLFFAFILLGGLLVLGANPTISPFIYALF